jgi:hypothetical protein
VRSLGAMPVTRGRGPARDVGVHDFGASPVETLTGTTNSVPSVIDVNSGGRSRACARSEAVALEVLDGDGTATDTRHAGGIAGDVAIPGAPDQVHERRATGWS